MGHHPLSLMLEGIKNPAPPGSKFCRRGFVQHIKNSIFFGNA